MNYIAFVLGCIVSWITVRNYGQLFLGYWYHRSYNTEDKYLELYRKLDDEFFFDMFHATNKSIKSYADYLRLHQKYESVAFEKLTITMESLRKYLLKYALVVFFLGVVFLSNALWYFLPIVVCYISYLTYEIKFKDHGKLFNTLWVLGTILDTKQSR